MKEIFGIFKGASACEQLQRYEDAISWCEKGLAVSFIHYAFMFSTSCEKE